MAIEQWQERKRPLRLEKRYEFDSFDALRDFLDDAADLSEKKGIHPDIGFSRSSASFTIHLEEGKETLTDEQREFAVLLDSLESSGQA